MVDADSTKENAEVRGHVLSCGGVFFDIDAGVLVRSDGGAGSVDCGSHVDFSSQKISRLGDGVFATMLTLQHL